MTLTIPIILKFINKAIEKKVNNYLKDIETSKMSSRKVGSLRTDILEFVGPEMKKINELLIEIIEKQ